ncbi:hypothetical protein ACFY93_02050 [Streptomyces sp. NPDC008313]|uniref:hypothetical protein n=1 Tax=Streptomyces sp. NPDC008313 TaxID=3364826 RepID=UPI0036E6CA45
MPSRTSMATHDHGDWAVPYQPADFTDVDPASVTWRGKTPSPTLVDAVRRIVEGEGPIHREVLHLHLGEVLYQPRLTAAKKRLVDAAEELLTDEGQIVEKDDFLDVPDRPCTQARWPLPGLTRRPVEHVAPAERRRALLGLVEDRSRELTAEQAVAEAAAFFGWSARTSRVPARLMSDLYRLRDTGALTGWPTALELVTGD